ncbi:MAG: transcriptional repressor [Candidatus Nanopelagicales bacterium]
MQARQWDQEFRARGLRATPQRQFIMQALEELEHASPVQILNHVHQRVDSMVASTVTRTLESLEDAGLVARTYLASGTPTFFIVDDRVHVHLVCDVCSQVTCIGAGLATELGVRVDAEQGFDMNAGHLTIHGACSKCRYMHTAAYI